MAEIDEMFHEFAAAFAGAIIDARPICFSDRLDRDKLDLTVGSLKFVDDYLAYVHEHRDDIAESEWHSTVLYGGAYVGEVIRNETGNYYRWIDYDDYIPRRPELRELIPERQTPTCAFLVGEDDGMSLPLNKIARFIDEGKEHSVHFFAQCDIQRAEKKP